MIPTCFSAGFRSGSSLTSLLAASLLIVFVVAAAFPLRAASPYPISDHFDGQRFHNPTGTEHGFADFWKWSTNREKGAWTKSTDQPELPPLPDRVAGDSIRFTWINHATVLIQVDSMNILTDPIWSERCSPVSWAGPTRMHPPGYAFEKMPPIDLVIVSHNHYDHLDLPTLRRLAESPSTHFIVPLGNRRLLHGEGIERVVELDWWETVTTQTGVTVECVPAQHFSARGFFDRNKALWAGYLIRDKRQHAVFFTGDTGWSDHFRQIREHAGRIDAALLPIGAYKPRWFMGAVHLDPQQAVEAMEVLGARTAMAIHFGTFPLADDSEDDPVIELRGELNRKNVSEQRFWIPTFGESRVLRGEGLWQTVQEDTGK